VVCPRSGQGVIVDTPGEASRILAQAEGIEARYIIITHTHLDHLGAFQQVRDRLKAPVAIHPLEAGIRRLFQSPPNPGPLRRRAMAFFLTIKLVMSV